MTALLELLRYALLVVAIAGVAGFLLAPFSHPERDDDR
jgi:hypothetical protein